MTPCRRLGSAVLVGSLLTFGAVAARAQILTRHVISLAEAQRLTAAGRAAATERSLDMVIAVVDPNGELVLLERMDNVQVGSVPIAQGKALTAARLKKPTSFTEDVINGDRPSLATLFPGAVFVKGGFPLTVNGEVVGGIGCSGGTSMEDEAVCMAAMTALSSE